MLQSIGVDATTVDKSISMINNASSDDDTCSLVDDQDVLDVISDNVFSSNRVRELLKKRFTKKINKKNTKIRKMNLEQYILMTRMTIGRILDYLFVIKNFCNYDNT